MRSGDIALLDVLIRIELDGEAVAQASGAEPTAAIAKGIGTERIVVENERHAVGAVGLVAHEQAERQVEVMGQVDPLVAHHGADLAAVVGVQRVDVAAVDVGGRAVEHQVGAGDVGRRGIDAKLADLDGRGDRRRAVIVVGKQHPVAIGDGIGIGRKGDLQACARRHA